jgi:hypothetical protein
MYFCNLITMTYDSFNSTAYVVFQGVLDYDNVWPTSWVPTFGGGETQCNNFQGTSVQKNQTN